jgi:hypothetical protein
MRGKNYSKIARGELIEEIHRKEAEIKHLRKVLEFYADPANYFGIGFFADPPCGTFMQDFSDDHGDEEVPGFRPGKLARKALFR